MKVKYLVLILVLGFSSAEAIILGFIDGSDYLKMDRQSQYSWVYGAMDGIMAESIFKDKSSTGPWLGRCIARYDFEQLKAIFEKELNNNPESWHVPAALILKETLSEFCGEQ